MAGGEAASVGDRQLSIDVTVGNLLGKGGFDASHDPSTHTTHRFMHSIKPSLIPLRFLRTKHCNGKRADRLDDGLRCRVRRDSGRMILSELGILQHLLI